MKVQIRIGSLEDGWDFEVLDSRKDDLTLEIISLVNKYKKHPQFP